MIIIIIAKKSAEMCHCVAVTLVLIVQVQKPCVCCVCVCARTREGVHIQFDEEEKRFSRECDR